MKRQIRRGIFETNSSSMHSIVVTDKDHEFTKDEYENESWNGVGKWQQLHLTTDYKLDLTEKDLDFGDEPQILCTLQEKCAFAIASYAIWDWEMEEHLEELTEIIREVCPKFNGFKFETVKYEDNGEIRFDVRYGGVDHQSHGLLPDMLMQEGITLREFILNTCYYVIIDYEDDEVFKKLTRFEIMDKTHIVRRYEGHNGDAKRVDYKDGEETDEEDTDAFY